jgi:hypothetical protein
MMGFLILLRFTHQVPHFSTPHPFQPKQALLIKKLDLNNESQVSQTVESLLVLKNNLVKEMSVV